MTLPIREDLSIVSSDGGLIPARRYDLEGQDGWRQFETSAAADQLVDHCYGPTLRRAAFDLIEHKEHTMKSKNTICLWFDKDAHEAARFYSATFPDSEITAVHEAPADYPSGKKGDVLTVQFTVLGIPCLGLNGGPMFKHTEAFSFQIVTENQEETDRYWNAIVGNGGAESQCGWCKDRWGLSWQITPRALTDALAAGGGEAKRAFEAMMKMKNIDIAAIEAARRG
jgi:predicted 3-demethylubiquinone-9 3-methyltransferase (glyoxalase superfamily)